MFEVYFKCDHAQYDYWKLNLLWFMKQILYYKISLFFKGLNLHTIKRATAAFTDALI